MTEFAQFKHFIGRDLAESSAVPQKEKDALHWLERNREILPPVRFDCGREDDLIESVRELHRQCEAKAVKHEYAEFDGGHTWDYWRAHIRESYNFFARILSSGN